MYGIIVSNSVVINGISGLEKTNVGVDRRDFREERKTLVFEKIHGERREQFGFRGEADDFSMEIRCFDCNTGGSRNLLFILWQGFSVAKQGITALDFHCCVWLVSSASYTLQSLITPIILILRRRTFRLLRMLDAQFKHRMKPLKNWLRIRVRVFE